MALTLKAKPRITSDVETLRVTDISGEYDATTVTGGWGDPNSELSESAVGVIVQRSLNGVVSSWPVDGNQIVYDPAALNSKETSFEFPFVMDGHLKVTIFRLPVSEDGTTTVEGDTLDEEDFFYWNNDSLIWQIQSGVAVAVDFEDLIDEDSVVQSTCEVLFFPKLTIEHNSLYTEYMLKRNTSCDSAEELFKEIQHLYMDLAGAYYRFKSGAVLEAEDIIESLLKKYDLAV
jgi:hypothetical protein